MTIRLPASMQVFERGWLSSNNVLFTGPDETALVELTSSGIQERLRVRGELRKVFRLR